MLFIVMSPAAASGGMALPRVGWEMGVGYGHLSYDVEGSIVDADEDFRVTPTVGLVARWAFAGPWSFASGLRYARYGDRQSLEFINGPDVYVATGENTMDFVSIPARIELAPFAGGALGVTFGPELDYLLRAKRDVSLEYVAGPGPALPAALIFEEVGTFEREGDITGEFERLNVSATAGVSWSMPLGRHVGRIDARYAHGLTDARKVDALTQKTRGFELTLGMLW
jgi:hypothetical protein